METIRSKMERRVNVVVGVLSEVSSDEALSCIESEMV